LQIEAPVYLMRVSQRKSRKGAALEFILILHGDDDQIVPIGAAAMLSSKIVKGAILKVYPGAPHGLCST
jgi:fermentation-respiration switch protein FrsA (DUF1100 family)